MRQKVFIIMFILSYLIPVFTSSLNAKKVKMKFASAIPVGTPWHNDFIKAKKIWEKRSKNQIRIKDFFSGVLGGEKTIVRRTRTGSIQCCAVSLAALAPTVPELSILELPYVFNSVKEVDYILDDVLSDDFNALLEKRGFRFAFWHDNGWRCFATRTKPIKVVEDLKGLKMRSQENPLYLHIYQALGASPLPIAVPEVLSSLQTGVIDGFDQTPLYTFSTSWYEGIKYYSLTNHVYQPGVILYSLKWWNKLDNKIQKILINDMKEKITIPGRKSIRALSPILIENFKRAGVEVIKINKKELERFKSKTFTVKKNYKKQWGVEAAKLLDKMLGALGEYRKRNK